MTIGMYISIITLNGNKCSLNGLSAPMEKHRLLEWIQKQTHIYAVYKRTTSDLGIHTDKKRGEEKHTMQIEIKRKLE